MSLVKKPNALVLNLNSDVISILCGTGGWIFVKNCSLRDKELSMYALQLNLNTRIQKG